MDGSHSLEAAVDRPHTGSRFRLIVGGLTVAAAIVGTVVVFAFAGHDSASSQPVMASLRLPGHPDAVLAGSDGLWVALGAGSGDPIPGETSIVHVNPATGLVDKTVEVGGSPGFAIRVGGTVWLGNSSAGKAAPGELVAIDSASGSVIGRLALGGPAGPLAYGGDSVWAMLSGDNIGAGANLVRIDPVTRSLSGQPVHVSDRRSIGLIWVDGILWATAHDDGLLVRIDPATGLQKTVHVGNFPVGLAFANGSIWVANRGDATVSRVDSSTMQVIGAPIPVGQNPTWIDALGGSLWVANQDDGTVSRIDASTGRVVGAAIRIAPASAGNPAANAMADDGSSLWVTSVTQQAVSRIDPSR